MGSALVGAASELQAGSDASSEFSWFESLVVARFEPRKVIPVRDYSGRTVAPAFLLEEPFEEGPHSELILTEVTSET